MKLSVNASYLWSSELPEKNEEIILKYCKEAGFDVIDYTPGAIGWKNAVAKLLRASEKYELPLEQSHAPFNRYKKAPIDEFKERLNIAFDAAIAMGNKQIVVHCDDYPIPKDGIYDSKVATEETYEFWAPFAEKAANNGLIMAIETVFHDNRSKNAPPDRFGADLNELIGLIDRFDNPYVKCCWDSGHARLAFTRAGMPDAMRKLGDRICCTHIHDNYYNRDLHVLPFQGDIDWREHMATMKEIGYTGNLTYEIVYGKWPSELVPDFLAIAAKTGRKLIEMFENA